MTVSLLFVLIIFRLIYFCIKSGRLNLSKLYKEIFFIYLACSITINAGYAFKIGGTTVAYNTFLSLLLLILSILFLLKGKFNQKIMLAGIVFWVCIGAGLLLANIYPYKGGVVQNIEDWDYIISGSRYISYNVEKSPKLFNFLLGAIRVPVILAVLAKILSLEEVKIYLRRLIKIVPFVIGFGYLEVITKYILHYDIFPVVSLVIGNITAFGKLQGLTTEASQYALVLFIYSILILSESKIKNGCLTGKSKQDLVNANKTKVDFRLVLLLYALMILSFSLTAFYFLFIGILVLMTMNNVKTKVIVSILFMMILVITMIVGLPDYFVERIGRIGEVISSFRGGYLYQSGATSEGARLSSIYYALKAFIARPVFGVGLGNTDAHSTFFSMLANFGLVGIWSYLYIWKKFSMCHTKNGNKVFWLVIASMLLSGGIGYFVELYLPFSILAYNASELKYK